MFFYLNLLLNFILLRATKQFLLKGLPTHSRMHPIILVGYTVLADTIEPPWGNTLNPKWEIPFTYRSHSHHARRVQLSADFGMIKHFFVGLFFLDLWSFHINSHLNLASKYQSDGPLLWGPRRPICTVALMENRRADSQCWRDELRPWCEAARHRWSLGRPPSSDQACRRAQRSVRENSWAPTCVTS